MILLGQVKSVLHNCLVRACGTKRRANEAHKTALIDIPKTATDKAKLADVQRLLEEEKLTDFERLAKGSSDLIVHSRNAEAHPNVESYTVLRRLLTDSQLSPDRRDIGLKMVNVLEKLKQDPMFKDDGGILVVPGNAPGELWE